MYEINGVKYDENSIENQKIKAEFVSREVYCCMTNEVEYILRQSEDGNLGDIPFTTEDVKNLVCYHCPECGEEATFEETDSYDEDLEIEMDDGQYICPFCGVKFATEEGARDCCNNITYYKCSECGEFIDVQRFFNSVQECWKDVFEWWAVSPWLGDQLDKLGEPIIDSYGKCYLGRTCTGQAIKLDFVISEICKKAQLLEGQRFGPKVKESA